MIIGKKAKIIISTITSFAGIWGIFSLFDDSNNYKGIVIMLVIFLFILNIIILKIK